MNGDAILEVEIALELVAEYDWAHGLNTYREFLVPAALLNQHANVRLLTGVEVSDVEDPRWSRSGDGG